MARHPAVNQHDLLIIASYLARQDVDTEIHAEIPKRLQQQFEHEYRTATNLEVPAISKMPYYVWQDGTNKRGRQLRLYFNPVPTVPVQVQNLCSESVWFAKSNRKRINHTNLIMQLFQCGFVLGSNAQNNDRIAECMRNRFARNFQ